jgi:hypothetical protein
MTDRILALLKRNPNQPVKLDMDELHLWMPDQNRDLPGGAVRTTKERFESWAKAHGLDAQFDPATKSYSVRKMQ